MCADHPHGKSKRPGALLKRWASAAKSATHIFLTSDEPLTKKMVMVPKNMYRRVVQLSDCCGNYGEPGC